MTRTQHTTPGRILDPMKDEADHLADIQHAHDELGRLIRDARTDGVTARTIAAQLDVTPRMVHKLAKDKW